MNFKDYMNNGELQKLIESDQTEDSKIIRILADLHIAHRYLIDLVLSQQSDLVQALGREEAYRKVVEALLDKDIEP